MGVEHFVELPSIAIYYDHVAVAVRIWSAFDGRVARYGIRTRVALGAPRGEINRHHRLGAADYYIRKPIRCALPHRAKVRMQNVVRAHAGYQIRRVRVDRSVGDVLIPWIVRRKKLLPVKARAGT